MKRLASSDDSLGALMSMCPTSDENSPRTNQVYSREFQSMLDGLDEEGCVEEAGGHVSEKKRRLSVDQVKALEKNFEIENKLEPERKVKLAQELGLQPRQVAVWFQNRRARWKTKQLERDYGVLKANYDSLKANFENLQHDNEALRREIRELENKLNGENSNTEGNLSVKEEVLLPGNNNKTLENSEILPPPATSEPLSYENLGGQSVFPDMKDGSSDSDSSAILNEDNSPNAAICQPFLMSPAAATSSSPPSSSMNCFQFTSKTTSLAVPPPPLHYVKMEEHNFFSADETCNFFSDEQAPSLHWYCPEQWN